MKNFSGLPSKTNGQGPIQKVPSKKKQPVAFFRKSNLEKLESWLKGEIGIAPVAESCQLIWLAHGLIRAVEQRPEMYPDSFREARELRTVLFHLCKAHEKLTGLVATSKKPDKPSGNGRLLKIV